jgi:hypothetical protein
MGEIAVFGASSLLRRPWRLPGRWRVATAAMLAALLLAGCAPEYDWRDIRAPGGEYWVRLPAKPAIMTRRIHLEALEVDMTMQGAKVKDNAFTVALVPLPSQPAETAGMSPERALAAMREQMLRNIGAPPSTPSQSVGVDLVDIDGRPIGKLQVQEVAARGTGRHADMALRGRFGVWQGQALQIVAIGPDMDPEQTGHFLDSLRLVKR